MSPNGKKFVEKIDKELGLQMLTAETLLETLKVTSDDNEFRNLIRNGHTILNYNFFQKLTSEIETLEKEGNRSESEKLKALRSRILDVSSQIEDESKRAVAKANLLLQEMIATDDIESMVSEKIDQIDESFFYVLTAYIQEAKQNDQPDKVEKLMKLYDLVAMEIESKQNEAGA